MRITAWLLCAALTLPAALLAQEALKTEPAPEDIRESISKHLSKEAKNILIVKEDDKTQPRLVIVTFEDGTVEVYNMPKGAVSEAGTSGRTFHTISQTLLGFSLYSWSFPSLFELKGNAAGAVGLLTPVAWFGYSLYSAKNISYPEALAGFLGGISGALQGYYVVSDVKGVFPLSMTSNFLDLYIVRKTGIYPGIIFRKSVNSYNSFYEANMLNLIITGRGLSENGMRGAALYSLLKSYGTFLLFRNSKNVTEGDALFEAKLQILGAEFLPLILHNVQMEGQVRALTSFLGYAAGYGVGLKLSEDRDLSFGNALIIAFSPALASSLVGGLTLLFTEDIPDEMLSLYPVVDLGLTYLLYRNFSRREYLSPSSMRINISPMVDVFAKNYGISFNLKF